MKKIIVFRWVALIPSVYAAWYVVLIVGFFIYRFIEKTFCPISEIDSASCHNPTVVAVLDITVHVFVALSAIIVLLTATFIAPSYKKQIGYLVVSAGSIIALYVGSQLQSWSLILVALAAAVLLLIVKSKFKF